MFLHTQTSFLCCLPSLEDIAYDMLLLHLEVVFFVLLYCVIFSHYPLLLDVFLKSMLY